MSEKKNRERADRRLKRNFKENIWQIMKLG